MDERASPLRLRTSIAALTTDGSGFISRVRIHVISVPWSELTFLEQQTHTQIQLTSMKTGIFRTTPNNRIIFVISVENPVGNVLCHRAMHLRDNEIISKNYFQILDEYDIRVRSSKVNNNFPGATCFPTAFIDTGRLFLNRFITKIFKKDIAFVLIKNLHDSLAFIMHENCVVAIQSISLWCAFQSGIHDDPVSSIFTVFVPFSRILPSNQIRNC
jgi:hypothetical protein